MTGPAAESSATTAELRTVELFAELTEEQLRWVADRSRPVAAAPGQRVIRHGDPAQHFWMLLEGELRFTVDSAGRDTAFLTLEAGSFFAEYPILVGAPYLATGHAITACRLLRMTREDFWAMLREIPPVTRGVLRASTQREGERHGVLRQQEKLAALGSLAAGLAHELNNPAAAARRAAGELARSLQVLQDGVVGLGERGVASDALAELARTAERARAGAATAPPLDALERAERESELSDLLETRGLDGAWEIAGDLADAGIDASCVEALSQTVAGGPVAEALSWVAAGARAEALARELNEATARISALVGAVKEYSYMDRAPEQVVDVQHGIESTLTVLAHKLRQGDIRVVRDFAADLPPIEAFGAELNQVWTNLIDNAIDALAGSGTITIRTCGDEAEHVLVEVTDDGPGIPDDARPRIFEPFFTTKDVGQGTGLGLDVVRRIVVNRHHGDLRVDSAPGRTRFSVRLPIAAPLRPRTEPT